MYLGGVVDYIQLGELWFNLADGVIVFGGIAILVNIFVVKK
jgi:lipoprotein signal peptidase